MQEKSPIFYSVLDEEMRNSLERIYRENATSLLINPAGACGTVSFIASMELGLVGGVFHLDKPHVESNSPEEHHFWCIDGLSRIIDMTASQFNHHVKEYIPRGIVVIDPEDPFYRRYKARKIVEKEDEIGKMLAIEDIN